MQSRVTIVEHIYHQVENESPKEITSGQGYDFQIDSDEEPYSRTYKVTSTPIRIETGWIKAWSLVYIKNRGPEPVFVTGSSNQLIGPNQSSKLYPLPSADLSLSTKGEQTKVTVTVLPA